MAKARWTKAQVEGTKAAKQPAIQSLFEEEPESRADKMRRSRKRTNEFTKFVINWLNDSGLFVAWRNNNFPSTRKAKEKEWMMGVTRQGVTLEVQVEIEKVYFKSNQKTVSSLDIIGYRKIDGRHLEIEIKTGNDTLDKDQKQHLAALQAAGSISFATSNEQAFLEQIKQYIIEDLPF